jgi:hypothetical protein
MAFKRVIIRRVGPLFWLLGRMKHLKTTLVAISALLGTLGILGAVAMYTVMPVSRWVAYTCPSQQQTMSFLCEPADIYVSYWWLMLIPISLVIAGLITSKYISRSAT